jgi:hypothetical protein
VIKKFVISLVIAFTLLSQSFAEENSSVNQSSTQAYCSNLANHINELETSIVEGNLEFNKKIMLCLKQIETKSLMIPDSADLDDSLIINILKENYNNFNECFYLNIQDYRDFIGHPASGTNNSENILINTALGELPADQVKYIDANGDSNCQINTNTEKCRAKLFLEKLDKPNEYKKKRVFLYGCYGDEENPRYIDNNQNSDVNSFSTFDEEKGFIASDQQKTNLKKLANNEAGPVIGFINMIINYLVGIVFVLCMASLIYGGYNLIFAGFDSDMTEKGKNAIKYAITGFFLIMLSYTIVILVQSIF